jgi:hypothetical protein
MEGSFVVVVANSGGILKFTLLNNSISHKKKSKHTEILEFEFFFS